MASELGVQTIQHTNGTDALTIDSSGRVAQPALPYVMVTISANVTVTPDVKVPFNSVLNSSGISWDTTNYTFTVPVTGVYHCSGAVRTNGDRSYNYWYVADTSGTTVQSGKLVLSHGYSGAGFTTASGSCLIKLTAGTTYQINVSDSANGSVSLAASQSWLDIHLVG